MPRDHGEYQTGRAERGDGRDPPLRGVAAQAPQRGPQQREREVVRHLHRERPCMGEAGDEEVRRVDLCEGQVGDPRGGPVDVVLLEQQHRGGDQHGVGRHDPHEPRAQVLACGPRRSRPVPAGVIGVRTPQEETGLGEEDRDGQVETAEQSLDRRAGGRPRDERDVRGEHADRRESADPLERRDEALGASRRAYRAARARGPRGVSRTRRAGPRGRDRCRGVDRVDGTRGRGARTRHREHRPARPTTRGRPHRGAGGDRATRGDDQGGGDRPHGLSQSGDRGRRYVSGPYGAVGHPVEPSTGSSPISRVRGGRPPFSVGWLHRTPARGQP